MKNLKERIEMLRAMETIARNLNDETHLDFWLAMGVPDGAITPDTKDEELEWLVENNEEFADTMDSFACMMAAACFGGAKKRRGVLYCDGVISSSQYENDKIED